MKLRRKASTLALAVGATMATGALTSAEALSFSLSAATGTPDSQTLSFAKFDPALGTLSGVTFTHSDSATSTTASVTLSGAEGGTATTTVQSVFKLDGPSDVQVTGNGSAAASCSAPGQAGSGPGDECSADSVGPGIPPVLPAIVADNTDLGPYVGASGFFDVFISLEAVSPPEGTCTGVPTPTCTHSGAATWSGDLAVSFLFLNEPPVVPPAGVPEPTTLSLLGAGILGLGARLLGLGARPRRRRRVS